MNHYLTHLIVNNTTEHNVRSILQAILTTDGAAKERAIDAVECKNGVYESYFSKKDFPCVEPKEMNLKNASVEIYYG